MATTSFDTLLLTALALSLSIPVVIWLRRLHFQQPSPSSPTPVSAPPGSALTSTMSRALTKSQEKALISEFRDITGANICAGKG
ncbi:unnamed protein product [Cutaneotrichosporon oleaginosum]